VLRLNMRGAGAGRSLASGTDAAPCNRDLLPALQQARQLADQLAAGNRSLPVSGVGLSLGGTMLLNAQLELPLLDGLVCISSPLDLIQCADQFDRPRNRLYRDWVLRGPKRVRSLQGGSTVSWADQQTRAWLKKRLNDEEFTADWLQCRTGAAFRAQAIQ
jgi:alpha-beta hydrolase superfamily lysophospholipase